MFISTDLIPEGLIRAKVASAEEDKPVKTKMGMTQRLQVKFRSRDSLEVSQSILVYNQSPLLQQLIRATLGQVTQPVESKDLVGKECIIEVKHHFTGLNMYANVVSIQHVDNFVEEPNEDE
jgi:hypothetical protein